jgi:hypothetical protein
VAVNSRAKGKNGELDLCHTLRALFGWACRRTQQYSGWSRGGSSPDIEIDQMPDLFVECKRVQALNVPRALSLAVAQCGRRCPVVIHRPNRSPNGWMVTIRLTDLPRLCHAYTHAADAEASRCPTVASAELPG